MDSNDRERIDEAQKELQGMLKEDEFREAVVLIFANKQDLPNAMNAIELTERLGLQPLRNHRWYIQATCATQGNGLYEGLDWLSNELGGMVSQNFKKKCNFKAKKIAEVFQHFRIFHVPT